MQKLEKSILADALFHAGVRSRYLKATHDSIDRYPDQYECLQACVEIGMDLELIGVVVSCLISRDPEVQTFIDHFKTATDRFSLVSLGKNARAELACAISVGRPSDFDLRAIVAVCAPDRNFRASIYVKDLVTTFVALHCPAKVSLPADLGV